MSALTLYLHVVKHYLTAIRPPKTHSNEGVKKVNVCMYPCHLTRFGVAKDRWTAAERRTAAVITTAATAAAHAAPPNSDRQLNLFSGTH